MTYQHFLLPLWLCVHRANKKPLLRMVGYRVYLYPPPLGIIRTSSSITSTPLGKGVEVMTKQIAGSSVQFHLNGIYQTVYTTARLLSRQLLCVTCHSVLHSASAWVSEGEQKKGGGGLMYNSCTNKSLIQRQICTGVTMVERLTQWVQAPPRCVRFPTKFLLPLQL